MINPLPLPILPRINQLPKFCKLHQITRFFTKPGPEFCPFTLGFIFGWIETGELGEGSVTECSGAESRSSGAESRSSGGKVWVCLIALVRIFETVVSSGAAN